MTNSAQNSEIVLRAAEAIAECRLLATMTEEPDFVPGRTTRRFLTPPTVAVHHHLRGRMESLGMSVHTDAAGNLRGLWQPPDAGERRLLIGSHIDTVPDAGAFDGVLGVVLALHLVELAQAEALPLSIEVIAFSEEEGVRFGVPFVGSRALAGRFDPALLALTDADGVSLREAIANFGLDPDKIDEAQATSEALGFFEIHIEQGPVLEAENLALAVVTTIVGQTRAEVTFTGQANHAGTTPMRLRQDAVACAAEWIIAVESTTRRLNNRETEAGRDSEASLVATVGKLTVEPNAGNVVAGSVRATLDVRSARDRLRESAVTEMLDQAQTIATRRRLTLTVRTWMEQPAVPMDERLTAHLSEALEAAGHKPRRLPSGAGHDAMVMATRMPTAMLFLRSPGGISHHPAETVLVEDVAAAIKAAQIFIRGIAIMTST
jgi:allantoate deiminase